MAAVGFVAEVAFVVVVIFFDADPSAGRFATVCAKEGRHTAAPIRATNIALNRCTSYRMQLYRFGRKSRQWPFGAPSLHLSRFDI